MAWDFQTDPDFQVQLDWIQDFVKTEVEPLDLAFPREQDYGDKSLPVHEDVLRPLQEKVKAAGLWACHLGPELGGRGFGQVKLGLMNEVLGRSAWGPSVFGCQAPDSGNAEILAHYGNQEQKDRYLTPLLEGRINSCYSMTEPQAGSDPNEFTCAARREGDEWVIRGEKLFSSNLRYAKFAIVMAITNPDVPVHEGASMFLVPTETPGINIIRNVGTGTEVEGEGRHGYVRYEDVRVPLENLLGEEGGAFDIAQTRLGGGRLHHGMRTIGAIQRCFDMMCERALSRRTQGSLLADKQMVQDVIATSWIEILQFRLQVLHAAWRVDQVGAREARTEIAGVKVATAKVFHDVVLRAMRMHGGLGVSNEMPFSHMLITAISLGIADGPSEVHKVTIARRVMRQYAPQDGLWPREHLPERQAQARKKFDWLFEQEIANQ